MRFRHSWAAFHRECESLPNHQRPHKDPVGSALERYVVSGAWLAWAVGTFGGGGLLHAR